MKLLMILSIGLDKPGPSVHILASLIESLLKMGYGIDVILKSHGGGGEIVEALGKMGASFDRIDDDGTAGKNNFAMRYVEQIKYIRRVEGRLDKHKDSDVVYVHSNTAQLAFVKAIKRKIPKAAIVLNVQDIFPENMAATGMISAKNPLYGLMAGWQHKAYRKADAVIALSSDMKKTLDLSGAENVTVIPLWSYGESEVKLVPDENNRVLDLFPEEKGFFRCVYAGNTGNMQNVDVMLRAAGRLRDVKDVKFLIVGDGARIDHLKRVKDEKKLDNVRFLPMQPSYLAPEVYSMANVNLITLKSGVITTAFPSKTPTCLAVARPLIACVDEKSDYAGMIGACEGCRVVGCDDDKALADAIMAIKQSGRTVSEDARRLYETGYRQSIGVAAHDELFRRVAKNGGR